MRALCCLLGLIVLPASALRQPERFFELAPVEVPDAGRIASIYAEWWALYHTEAELFSWDASDQEKNLEAFTGNLEYVVKSNNRRGYKLGLGPFAHLDGAAFSAGAGFCKDSFSDVERAEWSSKSTFLLPSSNRSDLDFSTPDPEIDWVSLGKVTAVKNQGACGTCWAFAVAAVLESRMALATGELADLSTQELLDCAVPSVEKRGPGMLIHFAFDYVVKSGALHRQRDYNGQCSTGGLGQLMANYRQVTVESELELQRVVSKGPVAVAIQADQPDMQLYVSGVITGAFCQVDLNHGVLLVGYGKEDDREFWKIKNSWGTKWGEQGYARLCRNCGRNDDIGQCGVTLQASFPLITSKAFRSPLYNAAEPAPVQQEAPVLPVPAVDEVAQLYHIPPAEIIADDDLGHFQASTGGVSDAHAATVDIGPAT